MKLQNILGIGLCLTLASCGKSSHDEKADPPPAPAQAPLPPLAEPAPKADETPNTPVSKAPVVNFRWIQNLNEFFTKPQEQSPSTSCLKLGFLANQIKHITGESELTKLRDKLTVELNDDLNRNDCALSNPEDWKEFFDRLNNSEFQISPASSDILEWLYRRYEDTDRLLTKGDYWDLLQAQNTNPTKTKSVRDDYYFHLGELVSELEAQGPTYKTQLELQRDQESLEEIIQEQRQMLRKIGEKNPETVSRPAVFNIKSEIYGLYKNLNTQGEK